MKCVLCAARRPPRERDVEDGHVCRACRTGLRTDLGQILALVALAAVMPDPFASRTTGAGARPHPGSRPPLEVARLDPELVLVRLERDDPSSAVPLLVMLEDWERLIREERGFPPYGVASELRANRTEHATLVGVIGFLQGQVDYACDEPGFSLEQFADNVHRAVGVLRAMDPGRPHHDGWGIPCPADTDDAVCGRRLTIERLDDGRLDLHTDIRCPDCGTVWTAQRLLLVALADPRVTVWGYPEAITAALGIPAATLRKWHERGRITRLGGRYDAGQAFRLRHGEARA